MNKTRCISAFHNTVKFIVGIYYGEFSSVILLFVLHPVLNFPNTVPSSFSSFIAVLMKEKEARLWACVWKTMLYTYSWRWWGPNLFLRLECFILHVINFNHQYIHYINNYLIFVLILFSFWECGLLTVYMHYIDTQLFESEVHLPTFDSTGIGKPRLAM